MKYTPSLRLLSPESRAEALSKINQLAAHSELPIDKDDWIPSDICWMSLRCADACAQGPKMNISKEYFRIFDASGGALLMVLTSAGATSPLTKIPIIANILGVCGFTPPDDEASYGFMEALKKAREIIRRFPSCDEIVHLDTGFVIPLMCPSPPAVGSSSALQMPGVLLLPAGVPSVILAECWIHEALHTELYLAEWLEGAPPAFSDANLPTPWRAVKRPAALLLHGAYVFSSLLSFMRENASMYRQVPRKWQLSAAVGATIELRNIEEAIEFRKQQITEALACLDNNARLTKTGKIVRELSASLVQSC